MQADRRVDYYLVGYTSSSTEVFSRTLNRPTIKYTASGTICKLHVCTLHVSQIGVLFVVVIMHDLFTIMRTRPMSHVAN